jgi:hypothetical protein
MKYLKSSKLHIQVKHSKRSQLHLVILKISLMIIRVIVFKDSYSLIHHKMLLLTWKKWLDLEDIMKTIVKCWNIKHNSHNHLNG